MIEKFNLNEIYATSADCIHWEYHPNKDDILEKINELIDAVNAFEPKHGQWIKRGDNSWECSVCHEISCCNGNYCVDCGAKMNGGEDD